MSSFNKVVMMGNLTRDPEFKQLPSGQGVCRLGLATNRQFKSKNSAEAIQEVCFIDVDVWGPQAENCQKFLNKGSSVLVEGRLKLDSWQDNDGQKRSKHSIVADRVVFIKNGGSEETLEEPLDEQESTPKSASKSSYASNRQGNPPPKKTGFKNPMGEVKVGSGGFDDDLPF